MSTEMILRCEQLVKFYDTSAERVQAVRGVDLEVVAGRTTAIVGPSGSGKSSLLRMLAGLDRPTAGRILLEGVDLWRLSERARARARAQMLSHIHSRPSDNLFVHLTARMQLERAARRSGPPPKPGMASANRTTVEYWLDAVDLGHRADHTPDQMSGGERQRLAFARAALAGHRLVIADEPTSQLDSTNTSSVLDGIDELAKRGITVVIATHDRRVLDRMRQVVTLRDGVVASVTTDGSDEAVIDGSGRLPLPPAVQRLFPDRRVRIVADVDGERVELERP